MRDLYPGAPLLAAGLGRAGRLVSYGEDRETAMIESLWKRLEEHIEAERIFVCSG
jgi:hypothetical protein